MPSIIFFLHCQLFIDNISFPTKYKIVKPPTECPFKFQFFPFVFGNYWIDDQQIVATLLNLQLSLFKGRFCVIGQGRRFFHPFVTCLDVGKVLGTIAIHPNADHTWIGQQNEQKILSGRSWRFCRRTRRRRLLADDVDGSWWWLSSGDSRSIWWGTYMYGTKKALMCILIVGKQPKNTYNTLCGGGGCLICLVWNSLVN